MSVKGFQIDVSIDDLNDVTIAGSPPLADNHALIYNSVSGKWENKLSPVSPGIDDLVDVDITPTAGSPLDVALNDVLAYDSTAQKWLNKPAPSAGLIANSTGTFTGGLMSIGSPTTTVSITAGTGIVVDNYTDPNNPTYTSVAWSAFTNEAVTDILTETHTFFGINSAGSLVQQATAFTPAQHRDIIHIGTAGHPSHTAVLAVRSDANAAFDTTIRLGDLAEAVGAFNIIGNVYSANGANLNINKNAGSSYRMGANFHVSKKSPDTTTDPASTPVTFSYSYRGAGGEYVYSAPTTTIDPDNYDGAAGSPAALESVPVNNWQVQIVRYFPGPNTHRIEYGQTIYGSSAAAIAAIPDINHEYNPEFSEGVVRSYLVVQEGTTDLSTEATFVEAARFGSTGGSGAGATPAVSDLTDTTITTLGANELLFTQDGSTWINQTLSEAGIVDITGSTMTGTLDLKGFSETALVLPAASGSPLTTIIDTAAATYHYGTLAAIPTFAFSNPAASGKATTFTLEITDGATYPPVWPASVKWPSGVEPSWTSGIDVVTFITRDAGASWLGMLGGTAFA